jgi:peptidoglycan hydrolase-like protein with peptidoglycan-binding domain
MTRAPRFFGDDFLSGLLDGKTLSTSTIGAPPDSVDSIQQALNDVGIQPRLPLNGTYDTTMAANVVAYQNAKGLVRDGIVGPLTMGALDADFVLELFQRKANAPPPGFPLGKRTGDRVDFPDGTAACAFENGTCVEIGHAVAYFLPAETSSAWSDAGGMGGAFGPPIDDPRTDTSGAAPFSFQEFSRATYIFNLGGTPSFPLSAAIWAASSSARARIGAPTGPPQPIGSDASIQKAPHDAGVVLTVGDSTPIALENAVFAVWMNRQLSGQSLGAPVSLAYLADDGTSIHYPFENGTIVPGPSGPTA